jgi:tetratricopeptide (TPR) repeat protein
MTAGADDTTSDYGSVLPLPGPAGGPALNEALLSRLVVAQGLCTREQLRGLLAGRATGDLRPLEELLLAAGIVGPDDLERLRSGAAPVAPSIAPPPSPVEPTPPGGIPGSSKRGWGAAAVADEALGPTVKFGDVLATQVAAARGSLAAQPPTDVDGEAAGESTLSFDRVISPAVLAPTAPTTPTAPTAPSPTDPARPFSASQMEWGRARGPTTGGASASDEDSASTSGERSSEWKRQHDPLVRAPRGPSPWRFLVPLLLVALAALAGARLVAWSRQRRRAEWRTRVDAALGHVAQGDGQAALAVLPDERAPDSPLQAVDAARGELARGATQILAGDPGPGLVALGRGDAALPELEPATARAIERLRARALVALDRGAEAAAVLDALLARAPDDFAALELLAVVELDLGRLDPAARHLEAAAACAPDEGGRARALRRVVDLALDAGDPGRALAVLERVPGRRGGAVAVARGDVAFVLGRLPQASEAYAEALADATAADDARLGLARASLVLRDLARARELLDAAAPGPERELLRAGLAAAAGRPLDALALVTGLGDDPAARVLVANLQLALGDARAALTCLEGLAPEDGGLDRLCRALRARARLLLGDLEAARTEIDLLKRSAPSGGARAPVRPRLLLLDAAPLTAADVAALDAILLGELALATEPLAPEAARAALSAAPTSARAQLVRGLLERRAGELAAAKVALTEAAALAPRDPAPRVELARVLLAQGALDPARAAFDEAVALDPAAPGPRLERAELLLRLGDPDGAGEDLRRCHGVVDPLRLLVLQARVAGARGATGEAADRWLAALRLDPDDPRLLGEAARACGAAGRLEQAERLLGRLADQHPSDPGVQLGRARLLLDRGQLEPALEAATRAAQLGLPTAEDAGAAHVLRAVALLRLGRADEAGAALDEAARTGESADALVVRALVVVHGATPATLDACATKARALLDRTLALDLTVSAATVLSKEGQRHAEAGRPVAAELAFRLALERDRAFLDAHRGLVRLFVARGDWRATLEAAGRLLAEHPDDPTGREALALAEKRLGR